MDEEQPKGDDPRSPHVFEGPHEAEILTGDTSHQPGQTVEPWEEPDNTRGFQQGGWSYDHDFRYERGPGPTGAGAEDPQADR